MKRIIGHKTHFKKNNGIFVTTSLWLVGFAVLLTSCLPLQPGYEQTITPKILPTVVAESPTPSPTRRPYDPGELVDYFVQDGDSLPALAARFNTTVLQIQTANPVLPPTTTTLPPGLPLKIPIYYLPLWGSSFEILPDYLFVNGPAQRDFNTIEFVQNSPGWLKDYKVWAYGGWRTGGEVVDYIGMSYSISPRLLLALLEYQTRALSNPTQPENIDKSALRLTKPYFDNLYLQLLTAADTLNGGYYGWRSGQLLSTDLQDSSLFRFDPWLNAGTVALQYYFSIINSPAEFSTSISSNGILASYVSLFGELPGENSELIPGSLKQPAMLLPFAPNRVWSYTGAPHPAWGENQPWAAIDFAPPADKGGCASSPEWVTAVADGVLSRAELGLIMLDLDGDRDERTGWVVMYLHLSRYDAAPQGKTVKAGDVLGHPSCERGNATGTHVHIARKFNGEWIMADGILPFNLEDWIPHSYGIPYKGTLTRFSRTLTASTSADINTQLESRK